MLYPSASDQEIFSAAYVVWVAISFVERRVVTSSGRGTTKTKADRGSAPLICASVFLSIAIAYGFAYAGLGILAGSSIWALP